MDGAGLGGEGWKGRRLGVRVGSGGVGGEGWRGRGLGVRVGGGGGHTDNMMLRKIIQQL